MLRINKNIILKTNTGRYLYRPDLDEPDKYVFQRIGYLHENDDKDNFYRTEYMGYVEAQGIWSRFQPTDDASKEFLEYFKPYITPK